MTPWLAVWTATMWSLISSSNGVPIIVSEQGRLVMWPKQSKSPCVERRADRNELGQTDVERAWCWDECATLCIRRCFTEGILRGGDTMISGRDACEMDRGMGQP